MGTTGTSIYGTSIFPRPHDDIDPKNKDQRWMQMWCEYIYAYGHRSDYDTPYHSRYRIITNNAYASDSQDSDQYFERLNDGFSNDQGNPIGQTDTGSGTGGGNTTLNGRTRTREGYMNINDRLLPVMTKYMKRIVSKFMKYDHDITAQAIDEKAGEDKENDKWNSWFEADQRQFLDAYNEMMQLDVAPQVKFIPSDIEELELYEALGGFKQKHEIALENIIKHSFNLSQWDDEIKKKLITSMVANNRGAVKERMCPRENKFKAEYLTLEDLIIPYRKETEYMDPEFFGYLRLYKPDELRIKGLSEEKIRQYAENFQNRYGNNNWDAVEAWERQNPEGSTYGYDDFNIPCLECEWDSVDTYYRLKRKNKNGSLIITDEYFDTGKIDYANNKYENRPDRDLNKSNVNVTYKATWIIESDFIFDYGKTLKSKVHVYKVPGERSIVETCAPLLDEIQIIWYKMQNAIAKSAPPGLLMDFDAVNNISEGMNLNSPLDMIRLRTQTGDMFYKFTPMGLAGTGMTLNQKPVVPLEGGVGAYLQELDNQYQSKIAMINQNLGIVEGAGIASPGAKEQSVTGLKIDLDATNDILGGIYLGVLTIKKRLAMSLAHKIQLSIQQRLEVYKAYYPVVGKMALKTLEVAGKMAASDYGISLKPRPTEQLKAEVYEQIKIAMNSGKDGKPTITGAQGLLLIDQIEGGEANLRLIALMLQNYENRTKAEQREIQRENISLQQEESRATNAAQAEAAERIENIQHANRKDLESHKAAETRVTNKEKHDQEMVKLVQLEKIKESNQANVPETV